MKPSLFRRAVFLLIFIPFATEGGTWSDHFSAPSLEMEWQGNQGYFRIANLELEGESALPLPPSPFSFVEIEVDSTDCSVGVWMNVVSPNLHVCTKGALVLRHSGTEGYVLALHEATQTVEVYRLSNKEMLLNKPWKIDLTRWYYVRAELHGSDMTFFVDGVDVGRVSDSVSLSGKVGLAVQDAESVLFDDFVVSGPNVVGNVDDIEKPEITLAGPAAERVVLRFTALPPYDYFVQVSQTSGPSRDWTTVASYRAKLASYEVTFTDAFGEMTAGSLRFYRVEKVPCYCR